MRVWIECMLGISLGAEDSLSALRSGELLCDLINLIKPGIVPKIARKELLDAMPENRRHMRMRENIGQYVDACAELGVPGRELFLTADLFERKNPKAVYKSLDGLARLAHHDVPGFKGPHVGKVMAGKSTKSKK